MYQVSAFVEERLAVQQELIRRYPLGLLVCTDADGQLCANSVPFLLATEPGRQEQTVLQAHLAKGNPQWQVLQQAQECLVVFQGPQAYVSPNWYPSKRAHGKVVPTWNYVTVHARGTPKVITDSEWIHQQITALTQQQEQMQADPWQVSDAPATFTKAMVKALVGVEITVSTMQGKWKLSQNRSSEDAAGVAAGMSVAGHHEVAALVAQRHKPDG